MDFLQSAGLGIVAAVICLLLKQYRPEFALVAAVACGALLLLSVVSALSPIFSAIEELVGQTGVTPAYLQLVLKAFGICYLAQLAADTLPRCGTNRHCGENRACRACGGSRSFSSAFSGNRADGSRPAPKRMKRLIIFVLVFWSVGTGVLLAAPFLRKKFFHKAARMSFTSCCRRIRRISFRKKAWKAWMRMRCLISLLEICSP